MRRRAFLGGLAGVVIFSGTPGLAQTGQDQIVARLTLEGYTRITIRRTFLGRVRITASGPAGRREIVLNPATGAILRDYIDRSDGDGPRGPGKETDPKSGKDDEDEEDDDEDEEDDDEDEDDEDDENEDDKDDD